MKHLIFLPFFAVCTVGFLCPCSYDEYVVLAIPTFLQNFLEYILVLLSLFLTIFSRVSPLPFVIRFAYFYNNTICVLCKEKILFLILFISLEVRNL